ncbi:hypothetical protein ACRB68_52470 [Actinomadura sp. RB68]|uniref:Uncharacterized protein n=1 Tax=Actinomadura macrotermitis TaxID=2585200 RepID=A0A7K0C112_9ACTN|nr:hypothetical protein [Actinomadura macrotermitis]
MYALLALALITAAAGLLAALFGADTRDGLDWAPNSFWQRRTRARRADQIRKSGSPAPASADRAAAERRRTLQAAG